MTFIYLLALSLCKLPQARSLLFVHGFGMTLCLAIDAGGCDVPLHIQARGVVWHQLAWLLLVPIVVIRHQLLMTVISVEVSVIVNLAVVLSAVDGGSHIT